MVTEPKCTQLLGGSGHFGSDVFMSPVNHSFLQFLTSLSLLLHPSFSFPILLPLNFFVFGICWNQMKKYGPSPPPNIFPMACTRNLPTLIRNLELSCGVMLQCVMVSHSTRGRKESFKHLRWLVSWLRLSTVKLPPGSLVAGMAGVQPSTFCLHLFIPTICSTALLSTQASASLYLPWGTQVLGRWEVILIVKLIQAHVFFFL